MLAIGKRLLSLTVLILLALVALVALPSQSALAIGGTIAGQAGCEAVGGSWQGAAGTGICTITDLAIGLGETLSVASGVILETQGVIALHGTLQNNGSIVVSSTGAIESHAGTLRNSSILIISSDANVRNGPISVDGQVGTVHNDGTIRVDDGGFYWNENGTLHNNGTIVNDGRLLNGLDLSGGGLIYPGTINNHGTIRNLSSEFGFVWEKNGELNNYGTIENNGRWDAAHIDNFAGGIVKNSGSLGFWAPLENWAGGIIDNHGGLGGTVHNNGTINNYANLTSSSFRNYANGTVSNDGTITIGKAGAGGGASNEGTIDNKGLIDVILGARMFNEVGSTINNEGSLQIGDYRETGMYNYGTINNSGGSSLIDNRGLLSNEGLIANISGKIVNAGRFEHFGLMDNAGYVLNYGEMLIDAEILNGGVIHNYAGFIYVDCDGSIAGNPVTGNAIVDVCDYTPPIITSSVSGVLGDHEWYVSDVRVEWTVTDSQSDIVSTDGCETTIIDTDTDGVTLRCSATSDGGTSSAAVAFKRDATPPTVLVTGVADGETYILGTVPAAGCDTQDALSGVATVATLTLSGGDSNGVGTITATCAGATDNAGNEGSSSVTYTVITPVQATQNLEEQVATLDIQPGVENSLQVMLDAAIRALDGVSQDSDAANASALEASGDASESNDVAAVGALGAFIDAVEAQRDKKLSDEEADALVADAQAIIDAINAG